MVFEIKPEKIIDFWKDSEIVNKIYELTKPSYVDNTMLMDREINHCRDILIIKNEEKIVAFTMFVYEKISEFETCYIGLSYVSFEYSGKGLANSIWRALFEDVLIREKELKLKIVCWWTTALPIVYKWFNRNINNVEPNLDGNFSENGKNIFLKIIDNKYTDLVIDHTKPFVLKAAAKATVYSEIENKRLDNVDNKKVVSVFEKYGIDKTNGDRFLMIGYVPNE